MKNWKYIAATAMLGAFVASPASAATTINYNDVTLNTTQPVYTVENRTMVAMRDLFENLEGNVAWDETTRQATLNYRDVTVKMYPDTGAVLVNAKPQALDVRPQIINDRIYLPLRFVAQTLGSTVDYTQLPNGDGVIDIHSMDSAENFVTQQGNVTRIVRTATDPVNSTTASQHELDAWKTNNKTFFYDDHGNLVELQSVDNKLVAYVTDMRNASCKVTETAAPTNLTTLGEKTLTGQLYQVALNEKQDSRYVGVGRPVSQSVTTTVEGADKNVYYLQEGAGSKTVVNFDRTADSMSVGSVSDTGFVIDLADTGIQNAVSGKADDGCQAFLLDDYLMFVDKAGELKQDTKIRVGNGNAKIYTSGARFLVLYVNADLDYPELYVTEYDYDKNTEVLDHNISQLTRVGDGETFYPYNHLEIIDSMLKGSTLYALAKTDMDYYVVTYNYLTQENTKIHLSNKERDYTGFIDTLDAVKLIATDNNYYYLRDVK